MMVLMHKYSFRAGYVPFDLETAQWVSLEGLHSTERTEYTCGRHAAHDGELLFRLKEENFGLHTVESFFVGRKKLTKKEGKYIINMMMLRWFLFNFSDGAKDALVLLE